MLAGEDYLSGPGCPDDAALPPGVIDRPVAPLPGDIDFDVGDVGIFFGSNYITAVDVDVELFKADTANFRPYCGYAPTPANQTSGEFDLTLRLGRHLRIRGEYFYTDLQDEQSGQDLLRNQIARARFDYQFNPKLSLRIILQYDKTDPNESLTVTPPRDNLNADLLVTYLVNPWTAFYFGLNSNETSTILGPDDRPVLIPDSYSNANQVFFKLSYLFRP